MSQIDTIKQVLKDQAAAEPSEGTIYAISADRVDVRVRGSATLLKNIAVAGSVNSLQVGQTVTLKWEYGRPIAVAVPGTGFTPLIVKIAADNDSIENAAEGIRVKAGGIRLWHCAFRPSLEGHTHKDMLQMAGWTIDANGDISNSDIYIHVDGQISLGTGTDILKLDAQHETHRLWIGSSTPGDADFSVDKSGRMSARSGDVGGWDILSDRFSKNGAELKASGELTLGSGGDSAVLSAINPDGWKLWLGADDPAEAPFRVKGTGQVFLDDAIINSNIRSGNYMAGSQGWAIDTNGSAEFNNVSIRGTMTSVVFASATTSIMGSRTVISDGGTLVSDVGNTDTTIDVDTNVFAMGDMLVLQADVTRQEWMQVTVAPVVVSGGFRYGVQRDLAGTGTHPYYAGETVASKGTSVLPGATIMLGEFDTLGSYTMGMISSSATGNLGGFLTLEGGRAYGPYFGVARRFGPVYNQISDVLRIGRLTGFLDITESRYGFATGDSNRHMTYTNEDGLQIVTNGGATTINDNGVATDTLGMGFVSAPPAYLDQFGRLYLDHSTHTLRIRYKDGVTTSDIAVGDNGFVPSAYAVAAKGVTNGDSHDHNGGDGGTIAYSSLSGKPTLPGGTIVGTSDIQTLTGKTLTRPTTTNPAETHQTLADGATVNWDMDNGASAQVSIAASRTIAAPTHLRAGATYLLMIIQAGSGSYAITWNAMFKWSGAIAPVLTTTVGAKDIISFWSDGTYLYGSSPLKDVR